MQQELHVSPWPQHPISLPVSVKPNTAWALVGDRFPPATPSAHPLATRRQANDLEFASPKSTPWTLTLEGKTEAQRRRGSGAVMNGDGSNLGDPVLVAVRVAAVIFSRGCLVAMMQPLTSLFLRSFYSHVSGFLGICQTSHQVCGLSDSPNIFILFFSSRSISVSYNPEH